MKKCLPSLTIKEMQIKTMLSFQLIPVRMAAMKNTNSNKMLVRCEGRATLIHCWWECKFVQPLWETVWKLLKKLKLELPYDPEIPLLQYTLRKVSQVTIKASEHSC
jgi:hypothetical protein